jgi:hypothetical protein
MRDCTCIVLVDLIGREGLHLVHVDVHMDFGARLIEARAFGIAIVTTKLRPVSWSVHIGGGAGNYLSVGLNWKVDSLADQIRR